MRKALPIAIDGISIGGTQERAGRRTSPSGAPLMAGPIAIICRIHAGAKLTGSALPNSAEADGQLHGPTQSVLSDQDCGFPILMVHRTASLAFTAACSHASMASRFCRLMSAALAIACQPLGLSACII